MMTSHQCMHGISLGEFCGDCRFESLIMSKAKKQSSKLINEMLKKKRGRK